MEISSKADTVIPEKPSKTYHCSNCDAKFQTSGAPAQCPRCGVRGSENFSVVSVEYDPEVEQMETEADWQAGD